MSDLEFTGERYIQGQGGVQMAYEHLHRYYYAAQWASGKTVLDVAAGSGYGVAILAHSARRVCAIDLDRAASLHARATFDKENIAFLQADATCLPVRSQSIELVVALEILEHVAAQESLIRELARVAQPNAPVLISTPNRASYSDARNYTNPFHVHEFYRAEFIALLRRYFGFVHLLSQQVRAGSLIDGETALGTEEIIAGPAAADARAAQEPMYFLALCSVREPCERAPGRSAYLDTADAFFLETGAEMERLNAEIVGLGRWARDLQEKLAEKEEALRQAMKALETEVAVRDQTIRELQDEMRRELEHRDRELVELRREFEQRSLWASRLQQEVSDRDERLRNAVQNLEEVGSHLATIRHAFLYRVLCRLGILPK